MKPEFTVKKQKAGDVELVIKGDLIVQYSLAFKESLAALVSSKGKVAISLQAIQSIDISAIQLLSAFKVLHKKTGVHFSIRWPENKSINELLDKTGIQQAMQH